MAHYQHGTRHTGTWHSDSKAQGTQDTIRTVRGTEHPSTVTETAAVTKVQFRMLLQPTIGVDFFKVNMNKVEVGQDLDIVTSVYHEAIQIIAPR